MIKNANIPALFGGRPLTGAEAFASSSMTTNDYAVLGGALSALAPRRVFEIGTYRGGTSQFVLELLPNASVVSIATLDPRYNDSRLTRPEVGQLVTHRDRYTQLIGDSHQIDPAEFLQEHGAFDVVFIDGDHSFDGVRKDTELVLALGPRVIFWHDVHPPHGKWPGVAKYLEAVPFVVYRDGNIGCWMST